VLVDGAHALGQLPVNLGELGADYFVGNCHKWLCGARGSAVMWVHPARRQGVRPLVLSHGSGAGFTSDFIWDGALAACMAAAGW
jgi:isopenicillin-N epimerase